MRCSGRYAFFVAIILLLAMQSKTAEQTTSTKRAVETVSLCQLTTNWRTYDHKLVRVKGIYVAESERSELYDPVCATSDHTAWVPPTPYGSLGPPPQELNARLNDLLEQDRRARVTVIGEFDGPPKVDIPPGLSPEAAEVLRAGNRYGHLNHWDFQFVFSKLEKVEPSPASDPWPNVKKP